MRIISGVARGRKINSPKGLSTRPTLDRVREAVFGRIQNLIPGAVVLDLFAGSGAFGLEAISRGASYAYLNDYDKPSFDCIRANVALLGFENQTAVQMQECTQCIRSLELMQAKIDIAYLDPPYESSLALSSIGKICNSSILKEDSVMLVEHSSKVTFDLDGFEVDTRKYGATAITMLKRKTKDQAEEIN